MANQPLLRNRPRKPQNSAK